jgi:hypothetical protein
MKRGTSSSACHCPRCHPPDIMYLRNDQHRELYLSDLRVAAGEAA